MKERNQCLPDLVIGLALLLFLITLSLQMPAIPKESGSYPLLLMVLSYIMTFALIIKNLPGIKNPPPEKIRPEEQLKVILPYAAMILAYLFLLDKIGYIAATILFSMVSLAWLGLKSRLAIIIFSVALTLALYLLFTRFLAVILPRGSVFTLTF